MFLNLLGNIFASWEANFVSATMFPKVGKLGNIDRKHNVSATMFPTIIFKTIGTHSPEAYNLREIESPAPPFQCCVTIFILFQAPTISAYNTTTLIGEGAGEGRNVTAKLYLPDNYAQTVGVPTSFETDCPKAYLTSSQCSGNFIYASSSKSKLICQFMSTCFICTFHGIL